MKTKVHHDALSFLTHLVITTDQLADINTGTTLLHDDPTETLHLILVVPVLSGCSQKRSSFVIGAFLLMDEDNKLLDWDGYIFLTL